MCRITLYSLNKDDDTHIPNLIAINLKEKFIAFFCISYSQPTPTNFWTGAIIKSDCINKSAAPLKVQGVTFSDISETAHKSRKVLNKLFKNLIIQKQSE